MARLRAVRKAVGDGFELMVDANQCFTLGEALRRAPHYAALGIAWFEEPLPADDITGHARLAAASAVPIAVGESLYSIGQFAAYVQQGAASILQVDVARVGGITPWLKVAHLAEAFNLAVCPHFLMELHVSLCAAVPSAAWVEYIPQLDCHCRQPAGDRGRPCRRARRAGPGHRLALGRDQGAFTCHASGGMSARAAAAVRPAAAARASRTSA